MTEDDAASLADFGSVDLIIELRQKARRAFRMAEVLRESDRASAGWWVADAFRLTAQADDLVYLMRRYLELGEHAECMARIAESPIEYVSKIINELNPQ